MTYLHYLYPLPPLERLSASPSRSIKISKELRRELFEQSLKPQLDWTRYRLWPKEPDYIRSADGTYVVVSGLFRETKHEIALAQEASWKIHEERVKRERAAAKEVCERMTIQEAWTHLQGHIHTNEYDIEGMSEADWDIFRHAKNLLNNHIKSL